LRLTKLGACLLVFLPLAAWGQEQLTLDQAISMALQKNRLVKVAQLEINKSEAQVNVVKTYRLPQFNLNMIGGQLLTKVDFTLPKGLFGSLPGLGAFPPDDAKITTARRPFLAVLATANQPLSQQYRIRLGIDAERLNTEIQRAKLNLQEQVIVNDVKKTYYSIVQAQGALVATEETVKLLKELERVATNAVESQAILKGDLLDAQAGLAKAESQAVSLKNTAATLKEKLNSLMARDILAEFTVTGGAEVKPWELDLAQTRAKALAQRPELREARLQVERAEIDRKAKKAEYIPDVNLNMTYISPFNIQFLPLNVTAVGLTLSWDVFDWGRKKQELVSKSEVITQAKTAVDEATSQIQVEVGLHFRKLEDARAQLKVANLALEADQEKVRVALNKYEQNAVLLKDVLQLKASLAEKTYKYQETLTAFWSARADLEKASGEK
jgi:outer membrane protein